jgi:alpha-L-arabinofuranosidase
VKARKIGGAEGFMAMVHVEDADRWVWANFGGWANTQHAFERSEGGGKIVTDRAEGSVESDRWYDLVIEVDGPKVVGKLDGKTLLEVDLAEVDDEPEYDVYASAVTDEATGDVVVRVVNIAEEPKRVRLSIDGGDNLSGEGTAITLAAEDRQASQSLDDPLKHTPKTSRLEDVSREFEHEFAPCSFAILRLERRGAAASP